MKICFLPALDSASDLKLSILSKNEKNRCSRCCWCYSVPPSDKFQETVSCIEAEPGDFSCIAYFSSMLFLTIFGEVMFQLIKINWECVLFWSNSHMAPMFETLFLRLVHLYELFENCSIRIESFLRDHCPFTTVQSQ